MARENELNCVIKEFNDFDLYAFMKGERKKEASNINEYEKKMQENTIFKLKFAFADDKGDLYYYDGDIKIQMDNKEIDGFGYNPKIRSDKLIETYSVVVLSVDKKKKLVKVSSYKAKEEPRKKLEEALNKGIETKEYLRVPATVVRIVSNGSVAMINLAGLGITGIIRLAEWSTAYTNSLYHCVKTNSEIEVVVTGYSEWKTGKIFDCSRRLAIDFDPWKNIEKRLPVRTVVSLTCVSKEDRKFFGVIDNIPELNAYCEYPDPSSGIHIAEGIRYSGYVAKVNEASKLLRVRIIKQIE